jgi:TATA-binding protein-associated factor
LQYLKKVCNHPKLVLNESHPEWDHVKEYLGARNSKLDDINHSAKLPALKQLLNDCGIGGGTAHSEFESVVSQHRALIFCQLKSMLNIIESDLLKKVMPEVTYLRLDGSVPPSQRHDIVRRFNNDASIDCLLLTTQVCCFFLVWFVDFSFCSFKVMLLRRCVLELYKWFVDFASPPLL